MKRWFGVLGSCLALPLACAGQQEKAVLDKYCVTCHSDKLHTGGLSLQGADVSDVPKGAETWEKVIRKVRVGAMPPQGMPRDKAALDGLASFLETSLDRAYNAKPNPGHATMHRLNRAEYANAIRDLLGLDIDSTALLPPDDESSGFDNIADVLRVSPSLMERYLSASWNISRLAVGKSEHRAGHFDLSRPARPFARPAHRRSPARHARRNSGEAHLPRGRRVHH